MHILLTGNTTFKLANFREGLIKHLIGQGHKVTVVSPPDDYVPNILDWGCAYIPLTMDRTGTSPRSEIRLFCSVIAHLYRLKPDVVLSYTIKNNIYSGVACRLLKIPFLPNVTGLGAAFGTESGLNRLVRHMYRVAFRTADTVFFQNASDIDVFVKGFLIDPHNVKLLPGSGVDLARFRPTPLPSDDQSVHFLMVTRMLLDKGVGVFCEAAQKIRRQNPNARFSLLGPLDPDSSCAVAQDQLKAWTASGVVTYLGATQNVERMLDSADCIVLPSFYHEGTPRALIEAAAKGRPIITTNLPGCRDLVRAGLNGFLVEPKNTLSLVKACRNFINLSALERRAMGEVSRRLAEETYDEAIVIDAYIAALKRVDRDAFSPASA